MTFGEVKSIIEKNIFDSYSNENEFKKMLKEFKYNVLNDKKLCRLYTLYDQLSTPQGLSEKDAQDYLNEGIDLIQRTISSVKLPKSFEKIENQYENIDSLVYVSKIDIKERVESKKRILSVLMSENKKSQPSINLPIESMVKIANQTINSYLSDLDENTKKEFFKIITEDTTSLKNDFEITKENTLRKLDVILLSENNSETKDKISETIEKIKSEVFDYVNYIRLKNLEESL